MKNYVLNQGAQCAKWIHWTGGISPSVQFAEFEKAYVMSEEFLNGTVHEKVEKNRRELILGKYPDATFIEVEIVPVEERERKIKQLEFALDVVLAKVKEIQKQAETNISSSALEQCGIIADEISSIIQGNQGDKLWSFTGTVNQVASDLWEVIDDKGNIHPAADLLTGIDFINHDMRTEKGDQIQIIVRKNNTEQ